MNSGDLVLCDSINEILKKGLVISHGPFSFNFGC